MSNDIKSKLETNSISDNTAGTTKNGKEEVRINKVDVRRSETTKRYPLSDFPKESLRPEVVARHEEHMRVLHDDITRYSKIGHRDQSMFDWLLRVFENFGLSTAGSQYHDSLAITKTRLAMFVVLIDDTVDNVEKRNSDLLDEISKLPFNKEVAGSNKFDAGAAAYFSFTKDLWTEIIDEVKNYPNYKKYIDAFNFDMKQLVNSMDYSKFVNTYPNAVNLTENDTYVHHGMTVLLQTDLDLMCSEGFDDGEFGALRELAYLIQKMAKIGNMLSTYPRELAEADMSSEVLVRLKLEYGVNSKAELDKLLDGKNRYPKLDEKLVHEWRDKLEEAEEMAEHIKSVDTDKFINEIKFIQRAYMGKSDYW